MKEVSHVSPEELNALTERVIGCAFTVRKHLGAGFLERVYENALAHECRKAGLQFEQQRRLVVMYDGIEVGDYVADLVVANVLLIEIKAGKSLDSAHEAQCLNYLAATGLPVCLLLNFGVRVTVRRIVGPNAPTFPPYKLVDDFLPTSPSERAQFADDE